MGKRRGFFIMFLLVLVLFIVSCKEQSLPASQMPKQSSSLSDLQTEACNAADKAGTCDSKLEDIGIVEKEKCCEALGKCC